MYGFLMRLFVQSNVKEWPVNVMNASRGCTFAQSVRNPQMSDTADLTSRQASALLGVHESSIKRWCDQGLLECSFTPGGHRRFAFDVMLDFARTSSLAPALLALDGFERSAWLGSEQLRQ